MTKQIKVSDETYERLKEGAAAEYRTIGNQIDYLMDGGKAEKQATLKNTSTFNFRGSYRLCKVHGIPLTQNGKCMQKGCKYA